MMNNTLETKNPIETKRPVETSMSIDERNLMVASNTIDASNLTDTSNPNEKRSLSDKSNARHTSNDIAFALIMLVCGFLFWNLIRLPGLGAGVTLFAAIFSLSTVIYLKTTGVRQTRTSLLTFAVICLSASVFVLYDNIAIKLLNFLFIMVVVIYWISLATGRTLNKKLSVYIVGDFFQQVLIVPFSNFGCCLGAIKSLAVGNQKSKSFVAGALGILVMIPILAAVINLLISADAAFAGLVANLHFTVSLDIFIQIIMGIPVASYLYGLIYGNRYGRYTGSITMESVDKAAAAFRFAPGVTVYSALTALNLVYIVFFLSQITYLFSAFNNQLPELMTYAEYARRGFFELCAVAAINLAVITAAHLIVKREKARVLQIETAALCLFTLMLIITAISKMAMYINTYGLTQLRVFTTWFMVLLFMIFIVTAIRQFKTFNATRIMVIGFVLCFLALSYGNVDGKIAAYNIERYKNGTLQNLDVKAISALSDATVPYMYDLYLETTDQRLKVELKAAILKTLPETMLPTLDQENFRSFNFQHQTAQNIRNTLK